MQAAPPVAHEHERTARAEEVAGGQQRDDEQPAIVDPGQDRGQIAGCDVRAGETVQDHDRRGEEEDELQRRPGVTPPEHPADESANGEYPRPQSSAAFLCPAPG